jgi:hypothetical protein
MANTVFSVFLSYSIKDEKVAVEISKELRKNNIEVVNFIDSEPLGELIEEWVSDNISDVDCVLVLLTPNSIENATWIEREVGLSLKMLSDDPSIISNIIPICFGTSIEELSRPFQPRDYATGDPFGPAIVWSRLNCLMLDRDGLVASVQKFIGNQQPKITIIKNPDMREEHGVFNSAMNLYEKLLPDASLRDEESNIIEWIHSCWDIEGDKIDEERFQHCFVVQHIKDKAIALLWCSIDKGNGYAFMNFWGTRTGHRSHGRSLKFAAGALEEIFRCGINIRNIFFCCEPVDWSFLDRVLFSGKFEKSITFRESAKTEAEMANFIRSLDESKRFQILDEMRKMRRFVLYSSGSGISRQFHGKKAKVFYYSEEFQHGEAEIQRTMSTFVQPPIREPFDQSECAELWLFNISIDTEPATARESVNWIYDEFLIHTLRPSFNNQTGFREFLGEKNNHTIEHFSSNGVPRETKPREWFKPYVKWLNVIKKYMLEEQKNGNHFDRWDIQL